MARKCSWTCCRVQYDAGVKFTEAITLSAHSQLVLAAVDGGMFSSRCPMTLAMEL